MLRGIARAGGTATTFTASGTYTPGSGSGGGVGGDGAPGYCVIVEI